MSTNNSSGAGSSSANANANANANTSSSPGTTTIDNTASNRVRLIASGNRPIVRFAFTSTQTDDAALFAEYLEALSQHRARVGTLIARDLVRARELGMTILPVVPRDQHVLVDEYEAFGWTVLQHLDD